MQQDSNASQATDLMEVDLTNLGNDYLVGGVTSGWNNFKETGKLIVSEAYGCKIKDVKGTEYIDWIMGWGSLLLGHNPESVINAIQDTFTSGFAYQYESPLSALLAKEICDAIPCADKVRLANSGTEATLHSVRVARKATGRKKIVKFEGHFHGLNDYLLYGVDCSPEMGSFEPDGNITPMAGSEGLPDETLKELIYVLPFNDVNALENVFKHHGHEIAGVILEPISLNIGCIRPDDNFLKTLRDICDMHGALLIFDEVLTGFRVALGGAGELFGVNPDLVCLGKALGCGAPVAALAGKSDYMNLLKPSGNVEMAGTNTGRQMTVASALAAIRELKKPGFYEKLRNLNKMTIEGCIQLFERYKIPAYVEGFGGRIGIHIGTESRPRNFREVVNTWNQSFHLACYRKAFYEKGLFGFLLPLTICPEPITLSIAHTDNDINETLNRFEDILQNIPYKNERGV